MEMGSPYAVRLSMSTPPAAADDEDEATKQTMELVWQLQQQEFAFAEQALAASAEQAGGTDEADEDADSLALAIRLQQEDDEAHLRSVLGVRDGETGSPSSMSFEQLLRLSETVGEVSSSTPARCRVGCTAAPASLALSRPSASPLGCSRV